MLIKILSWTEEHTGGFVSWAEIYHILWLFWVENKLIESAPKGKELHFSLQLIATQQSSWHLLRPTSMHTTQSVHSTQVLR
jgi:hypothetical protein